MLNRPIHLPTTVSLLLLAAVLAMRVRSVWATEGLAIGTRRHVVHLAYGRSGLYAGHLGGLVRPARSRWITQPPGDFPGVPPPRSGYQLGFNAASRSTLPSSGYTSFQGVLIPYWAPLTVFAALPAWRLLRRLRHRHGPAHGFPVDPAKDTGAGQPRNTKKGISPISPD